MLTAAHYGSFTDVPLHAGFSKIPLVMASVSTYRERDAMVTGLHNIDQTSCEVMLQEQQANDPEHIDETVSFVAWEPSIGTIDGKNFEVGYTDNQLRSSSHKLVFDSAFATPPVFLADMQTSNDVDTANLRRRNKSAVSVDVWVDKEQSYDTEVNHATEAVGCLLHDN